MRVSITKSPCILAALIAAVFLAYVQPVSASAADGEPPAPLSPYFFIEGSDSGVDRLPLKKTDADVRLNGFFASVRLSQVYRNEGSQPINATYIFPGSTRDDRRAQDRGANQGKAGSKAGLQCRQESR